MKLLIPTDAPFSLDPAPEGFDVIGYDPTRSIPDDLLDADAAVVWGFAADHLSDFAQRMPRLRWVQAMTAGPDALLAAGLPDRVQVTVGRGFHDATVTEHAMALTLALVTRLPHYLRLQGGHVWDGPGFRPLHSADRVATLIGARVLIWGFGSIGQHMAPLFTGLGAHVRGVASTAGDRGGYECFTEDALPQLLPATDVLVLVLPATPATRHALNAARMAALPRTALVVNVGRGSCVDEAALNAALRAGQLGGAGLDVFETEPLPVDSPLWDAPNTIITPHAAGGRPVGVEAAVRANAARFLAGEPLDLLAKR